MSHVLVLDFSDHTIHAVVIREKGARSEVEASLSVSADATQDPTAWGKKLGVALQPHAPRRAKVLATVRRDATKWQYLSLPPCPMDDLPDLVRMQIDLDAARAEEYTGYDLLPLTGDDNTPRNVLAATLNINAHNRIRKICHAADFDLHHIVPQSLGWPAMSRLAGSATNDPQLVLIYAENDSTLWATDGGEIKLFRQLQLPPADQIESLQTAIQSQLRRSLLGLAQAGVDTSQIRVRLFGPVKESATIADEESADEESPDSLDRGTDENPTNGLKVVASQDFTSQGLIEYLQSHLDIEIEAIQDLPDEFTTAPATGPIEQARYPLVALGLEKARGIKPALDFLHPQRSPTPQSNKRTLVLAAITAIVVLGAGLWQGYSTLQAPLRDAEKARSELSELEGSLTELSGYERHADRIRNWLARSPNLLIELQQLSESLRPVPLAESEFSADQDVVVQRFDLNDRRLVLTANVTGSSAVQPLENRLRNGARRVQREKSEARTGADSYPWHVQIAVDLVDGPQAEDAL